MKESRKRGNPRMRHQVSQDRINIWKTLYFLSLERSGRGEKKQPIPCSIQDIITFESEFLKRL